MPPIRNASANAVPASFLITSWGIVLVLWILGVIREAGAALFLFVVATGVGYTVALAREQTRTSSGWIRARVGVVFLLAVAVPIAFDIGTADVFNLTKFTLLIVGALILVALALVSWVATRRPIVWRNGLHWPALALVLWTAVAAFTGVNVRVGLLGFYGSYDGLLTAIALAVVFLTVTDSFTINGVRNLLSAVVLGAGGPIVFYGLIQMHDEIFAGSRWDWIAWGGPSRIWSTLSNPNHLAGFYAIILPLVLVLAVTSRFRWERGFLGFVGAGALLQVFYLQTRGAWLAVAVAVVVFVILALDEIKTIVRARPRLALAGVSSLVVGLIAAGMLLGPAIDIRSRVRSALTFSGNSTTVQRIGLWSAATRMALDDPLTGVGADSYTIVFQANQSRDFAGTFGPDQKAIQAHNVFFTHLANEGFPGLIAFVALLVLAFLRGVGASRRLRRDWEENGSTGAREARLLLVGILTGLAAYVAQASFDIQQIGLSIMFWLLLGVLAAIALDAGVPDSLKPSVLLAADTRAELTHIAPRTGGKKKKSRDPSARSVLPIASSRGATGVTRRNSSGSLPIVATVVGVVTISLAWMATKPYRADHEYGSGRIQMTLAESPDVESEERLDYFVDAEDSFEDAHAINSWEPVYPREAGRIDAIVGTFYIDNNERQNDSGLELLHESLDWYEKSIAIQPRDSYALSAKADVLLKIYRADRSDEQAREEAIRALRAATTHNPREPLFYTKLTLLLIRKGDDEAARTVVEMGLQNCPDSSELDSLAKSLGIRP